MMQLVSKQVPRGSDACLRNRCSVALTCLQHANMSAPVRLSTDLHFRVLIEVCEMDLNYIFNWTRLVCEMKTPTVV